MRFILLFLLSGWLLISNATAQMPFPYIPPSSSVVATFTGHAENTANQTTYTFTTQPFSTAAAGRLIVVGFVGTGTGPFSISSVTIGGVAATLVVAQAFSGSNASAEFWQATVPTGTTGTVAVTWSTGISNCGIGIWALYGARTTPFDTGSSTASPMSDTLNIASGGAALGIAGSLSQTSTYTWANLTERFDTAIETTDTFTGASSQFQNAQTGLAITVTPTSAPGQRGMVLASYRPN